MGQNPIRVGIVGSRKYENRQKIKQFIFKLKTDKGSVVDVKPVLIITLKNML